MRAPPNAPRASRPAATTTATMKRTRRRRITSGRFSGCAPWMSVIAPPSADRNSGHAFDFDLGVVCILEDRRETALDLEVASLLADHVEQRAPSELVGLADDVEVTARD